MARQQAEYEQEIDNRGALAHEQKEKEMNITELRNLLIDNTNRIWRESEIPAYGYRLDWIHPDAPEEREIDGTYITWETDAEYINLFSSDDLCLYNLKIDDLSDKFSIAIDYAQMAGGMAKDKVSADACQIVTEALYLAGDLEPGFSGSESGIDWWTNNGMVAEYNVDKRAFIIWAEGLYWIAATPAGYVKALEKAEQDIEKMKFNQLKNELSA